MANDSSDEYTSSSQLSAPSTAHPGMNADQSALYQAIVPDKGFISTISSSIVENIHPHLNLHPSDTQQAKAPVGQKASSSTTVPLGQHGGHIGRLRMHPWNYFCIFHLIELKLCRMVELYIPKNRMFFVFRF